MIVKLIKPAVTMIGVIVLLLLAIGSASNPSPESYPNIHKTSTGWKPDDGYSWVYPNDNSEFSVYWVPGKVHPTHQNVVASAKERVWQPASGYKWVDANSKSDWRVYREGESPQQASTRNSQQRLNPRYEQLQRELQQARRELNDFEESTTINAAAYGLSHMNRTGNAYLDALAGAQAQGAENSRRRYEIEERIERIESELSRTQKYLDD